MGVKRLGFAVLLLVLIQVGCGGGHGTSPPDSAPSPARAADTESAASNEPSLRILLQRAEHVTLIASDLGVRKVLSGQEKATLTQLSSGFAPTVHDRTGEGVYPNLALELQDSVTVTRLTFLMPTLAWDGRGWWEVSGDIWGLLRAWIPAQSFKPNAPSYLFQATQAGVSWNYLGSRQAGSISALWRLHRIVRTLTTASAEPNAQPVGEPLGVMTFEVQGVTEVVYLWADSFSYKGQVFVSPSVLERAQSAFNSP
jgi:hypothetical protein